jgi:LmbE family N-acetylglucosaminyl deacetylase
MKLSASGSEFFIPDGVSEDVSLERTTHVGIGAHQDDLEIMASHGILECFHVTGKKFLGITATNGAGSPRAGAYAKTTDEEMQKIRRGEQKKAAILGEYSAMAFLNHSSKDVKSPAAKHVTEDILGILSRAKPSVVYTHNFADKHDTHVGVAIKTLATLRALPAADRPKKVYGCEVWRSLDWMQDTEKLVMDLSNRQNIPAALMGLYDSQIEGGKRYDLAAMGRWRANATFFASHDTDTSTALAFAMDLTPLMNDPKMDPVDFTLGFINRFSKDVVDRIKAMS